MQIHHVMSVSNIKKIIGGIKCVNCGKIIVENRGRTAQVVIRRNGGKVFTCHLPIHKDCPAPKKGTIIPNEAFVRDRATEGMIRDGTRVGLKKRRERLWRKFT